MQNSRPNRGGCFFRAVLMAGAAAPRRFCAVRAFCQRQNLAAGRIYSARGFQKMGSLPALAPVGMDCPPNAQEKAIAAAKALAEEG